MIAVIIIAVVAVGYVLSTCCGKTHPGLSQLRGWAYTHRGLHGDDVPENSLTAFARAKDCGYGTELDVHLLADGNLAVIHDSLLSRMTGKDGYIEDLRADQLGSYRLAGTEETIPLFSDVLELFSGEVPLIVELKPHKNNHSELCQNVCELLDKYDGVYCVESFDPRCVYWFKKHRPDVIRGQLTKNYFAQRSTKMPWVIKFALTNLMFNFLTCPDFVAYHYCDRRTLSDFLVRKLWRVPSVAWTLTTKEDYEQAVLEHRIPIFEGFLP